MQHSGDPARRALVLVTGLAFGIVALTTTFRDIPLISADEIGYLGIARYLALGAGPNMSGTAYYHFGTSALFVPLWWISSEPGTVYRMGIVLTAALAAAAMPLLVAIARELSFRITTGVVAAAVIVALWPSNYMHAHLLWSETLFRLVFLAMVLSALAAARTGKARWTIGCALLAAAAYAVHPRALFFVPLAVLFAAALPLVSTVRWPHAAAAAAVLLAGLAATDMANSGLSAALWGNETGAVGHLRSVAHRVLTWQGLQAAAMRGLGHGWYHLAATFGLVAFGAVAGLRLIVRAGDNGRRLALGFVAATIASVFAASVAQMIDASSLDHLVYGRYAEPTFTLLLWLGILCLLFQDDAVLTRRVLLLAAAAVLLVGAAHSYHYMHADLQPPVRQTIGGILLLFDAASSVLEERHALFLGASVLALVFTTCLILASRRRAAALALLAAFVIAADLHIMQDVKDETATQHRRLADAKVVFALADGAPIHVDRSGQTGPALIEELMLFSEPFISVDVAADSLRDGDLILVRPPAQASIEGQCLGRFHDDRRLYRIGPPRRDC